MSEQNTPAYLKSLGISHICGSVLDAKKEFPEGTTLWDRLSYSNKTALALVERYDGFSRPAFTFTRAISANPARKLRK